MITAEDQSSGMILRADVIVDKINSLKIVTKTHELYLEETPEKFEVRAYDEFGNEFSTLRGIKFRWTIESGGGTAKGTDILRFMTWKDSPYNTEPILEKLESEGYQGNKVLLEGIKTGSAKVSVKLVDSQYSGSVAPAVEPLMVVANLFLVPASAFLLPCATLQYSANQIKSNKMVPVTLPSPNHNLVLEPKLGQLEAATVTAGSELVRGLVELTDRNVGPGEVVTPPQADLSIVNPASLELRCEPHKSWTVVQGREVSIGVKVMDGDNNMIYNSDNLHISLSVDQSYFKTSKSLKNGTLHTGIPIKTGSVTVTATLTGAGACDLAASITASVVLEIVPELRLVPELSLLAWDPAGSSVYSVPHTVTGGAEGRRLAWTSSNTSLASINQAGLVKVSGSVLGSSLVTAHLSRHSHCDASARVVTLPATQLSLVPDRQEFQVGSLLAVPLKLSSALGPISQCQALPLRSSQSDPAFTGGLTPSSAGESCASVSVGTDKVAHSKLTVAWSYVTEAGDTQTLSDSKYIASYSPLTPVKPASGETVVALETERELVWTGGPAAWPLQPSGHFSNVNVGDPSLVSVSRVGEAGGVYTWRIRCQAEGETKVTLTVGNTPSKTLAKPVEVSSEVSVHCARPHTVSLAPQIPGPSNPSLPPCPLQARQGRLAAQAYLDLNILVTFKDESERVIDSISGIKVTWDVSDQNLGHVKMSDTVIQAENSAHQILKVLGKTGNIDITASIERKGGLLGSSSHSDTTKLVLVEDAVVQPASLNLFELETGSATSSQGSGYFTVLQETKDVVKGTYSAIGSEVKISPVATGSASLTLVDLCLSSRQEAKLDVKVAGVHKVILETRDKVQLGDSISAQVRMVDSKQRSLPASSLNHVNLDIISEQSHITVAKDSGFSLTGASLGQAVMTGRVSYGGRVITSAPVTVTVYPPLVLDPRNISLVIGASFQFTHTGGPSDCSLQWSVSEPYLARTSEEGVVTSLALGATSITARAVDSEGEVYSEDTVRVIIRPLSSLQLIAPTSSVGVNTLLPVYLYGQDADMNVYSYGSALPILNIDWSVSAQSGGQLQSALQPLGHGLVSENSGVAVFTSSNPGKFTITATMSISSKMEESGQFQLERDRSLSISTTVNVLERLEITNLEDKANSGTLLLSPGASYQLRSNKNSVFSVKENSIITVTKAGLVKSSGRLGSATVFAKHEHEEVAVQVDVKPVHYLLVRAEAEGDQWMGESLESVPRGGKLRLVVTQHDKWGRQFSDTSRELAYRPSRFDLNKMRGGSVMDAVARGWTVHRIVDKHSGAEGWLVLRVGEGITGVSSLAVGDVVNFDTMVTGEGHWESEPAGVLAFERETGVVVGTRPGHTRLSYVTQSGNSAFMRQVSVAGTEVVRVDTSRALGGGVETVTVKVIFGHGDSNLLSSEPVLSLPHVALFSCDLAWDENTNIESVLRAKPQWTGSSWACAVTQVSPGPSHPAWVRLTVLGHVETLRYLPPITVPQTSVELGAEGGVVRVTGHSSVLDMIQTRVSDGLDLGSAWLEAEGELQLPVSLSLPYYSSPPSLTITVPATGQTVTVSVLPLISSCKNSTGFLSALVGGAMYYWQTLIFTATCGVLCVWATSKLAVKAKPNVTAPTPAPPPVPSSPSKAGDSADTTGNNAASPYLWTVDNSPIYGSPIFRYIYYIGLIFHQIS